MAQFNFNTSSKDFQTNQVARVEYPYLGDANLVKFGRIQEEKRDGSGSYDAYDFDFKLAGDIETGGRTPAGYHYIHREFSPREDDDVDKVKNLVTRFGYIMSYFVGEEIALAATQISGDSYEEVWDKLCKNADKALGSRDVSKKTVRIKIVGRAPQGQYSEQLGAPRYMGFLSDDSSESPVAFSKSEQQNNTDYIGWKQANASAQPAGNTEFASTPPSGGGAAPTTAGGLTF